MTLRPERVVYADRKAQERGISRSELIDALLAEAEEREIAAFTKAGSSVLVAVNALLLQRTTVD